MGVFSIASVLKSTEVHLKESVYVDFSERQMNFPMPINGRFDVCQEEYERKNFACWRKFYEKLEQNRVMSSSTKSSFRRYGQVYAEDRALLKSLRVRKRELTSAINELEQKFQDECIKECTE